MLLNSRGSRRGRKGGEVKREDRPKVRLSGWIALCLVIVTINSCSVDYHVARILEAIEKQKK